MSDMKPAEDRLDDGGAAPSGPAPSLAGMRKSYERAQLDESASLADPLDQFQLWMAQALTAQIPEPNAMTLATVGADGRPSTRVVLIKGCDARGIVWYTHYRSRKGRELAGDAFAALQFHWVELERVVRIEGRVEKTSAEESDRYFASRPLDSRIGAWASSQSEVIADRQVLVAATARYAAEFEANPPRPPHWGGYRLKPDRWEFWQGRPSRLHDRLRYRLGSAAGGAEAGLGGGSDGSDACGGRVGNVGIQVSDGVGWIRERLAP